MTRFIGFGCIVGLIGTIVLDFMTPGAFNNPVFYIVFGACIVVDEVISKDDY